MLSSVLLITVFITLPLVFLVLLISINLKYNRLKIKTEVFNHDIRSSLAVFNLTLDSLKEIMKTQPEKEEGCSISYTDLPELIEVLDEAKNNISRSINQWNT